MILLCGIPSESPIVMVREQIEKLGLTYVMLNQREFESIKLVYSISGGQITGTLEQGKSVYPLEDFSGVYTRLMEDMFLPEVRDEPPYSVKRQRCRAFHDALSRWYEVTPAVVANRNAPMGTNYSKPYQLQLIREQGFAVPDTLITNEPELVVNFFRKHNRRVIYKSISSVRSIVKLLEEKDLQRLDQIRWCPVQFQQFINGTNVRVHTIGNKVFATSAASDATDYRYAQSEKGQSAELNAIKLPNQLEERCINLSRSLGLEFAGIDLKITQEKVVYCFEVNPSPGFSYYEANTGQPIAEALVKHLAQLD